MAKKMKIRKIKRKNDLVVELIVFFNTSLNS